MANHVRRQIRDAVEALLIAANTSAGSNVFQHRNLSLEDAKTPAINITTPNENSERLTMGGSSGTIERDLTLRVEGYFKSSTTGVQSAHQRVVNALDTLAVEIENALSADFQLGGLAKDSYLVSTQISTDADGSVSNEVGVITLEYMVHYHTRRNTPTTAN